MKKLFSKIFFLGLLIVSANITTAQTLKGAWLAQTDSVSTLILATENYLSISSYDLTNKKFIETWGGKYTLGVSEEIFIDIDFHSNNVNIISSSQSYNFKIKKKNLVFLDLKFEKIEQKKENQLTGLWRITERANSEGKITEMPQTSRKTYKIMAGGYFQWFAIDTKSREFFGTGGGAYTLLNDSYTETIQFFSRDNNRVGAVLSFKAKIENGKWQHSGKSSKGDSIKEIWSLQN
jgi:hypothetical protein